MATSGELVEATEPIARSEAFRRLADRHLASSYRLARAILGDQAEAEDATHDAFVSAWRKWASLRDVSRFEHWFERILVNTCRNRMRSRRRWLVRDVSAELRDALSERRSAPGDPFRSADDRDLLSQALSRLNPDHRVVVALRYYRDLSVDEIADRLGVPSGTVKSRLHYALRELHQVLDAAETKEALR